MAHYSLCLGTGIQSGKAENSNFLFFLIFLDF